MPSKVHNARPTGGFPGSSFKYTPMQHVRVVIASFLQGLFSQAPLGQFHWDPDDDRTEIIIRDENPIHVEKIGARPAIGLTMGACQFYSLGMDDMYSFDFALERKVKTVLVPGTMTINVCSRIDIEAHNLAWVISEHLWLLRELLLKAGFFEIGRNIQIGPPSPAGSIVSNDSGDEWYCSSLSVPWQFARKSAFTPLGQQIANSIELRVRQASSSVGEGGGGPALAGNEYPIRVRESFPESFAPGASDVYGKTPDPAGERTYSLPVAPHPLNPAKLVVVETIRPWAVKRR